jgi:hypothetical protein
MSSRSQDNEAYARAASARIGLCIALLIAKHFYEVLAASAQALIG